MSYLKWNEKTISDFSEENINSLYNEGYVFGRPKKGYAYQTRSLRIDLDKFELSSENKRILKKISDLGFQTSDLPHDSYHWSIGKLAKDFYTTKFGDGTFSANKVKELLTTEHNFNKLFSFILRNSEDTGRREDLSESPSIGYSICYENKEIFHYSYPFYNLESEIKNLGMGMMLLAINYAKENNKKYIYLGSAKDSKATYKLQFKGLEWFDSEKWSDNVGELKNILK
jgi:leucyl-tRNA---protein transferase